MCTRPCGWRRCCFNSQPPEGGCFKESQRQRVRWCFNSQPPEGGCWVYREIVGESEMFQLTAARRRLPRPGELRYCATVFQLTAARRRLPTRARRFFRSSTVSTHSRPKAAAPIHTHSYYGNNSFNSQPPEGGCVNIKAAMPRFRVSTHSRPKAAASAFCRWCRCQAGFNSQPPEGGCSAYKSVSYT